MPSSSSLLLSLKVLLISAGVASVAFVLKNCVPLVFEFSVSQLPLVWSSFLSWLKPPYLYVIINGIIITIVATSRFHHHKHGDVSEPPPPAKAPEDLAYEMKVPAEISSDFEVLDSTMVYEEREVVEARDFEEKSVVVVNEIRVEDEDADADELVISRSSWTPPKTMDSSEIPSDHLLPSEKPLVSARFGHRKPVRASPEAGKALRVLKPKRHETLESTWKTITEGRAMPLARHLKKSDTWENHGRLMNPVPLDPSPVKKSETFRDRTNQTPPTTTPSPASGKLRREASPGQDELNRRVEAFIKKFNEEMRLQRQESLNQYKEMINRGSH